jgi:positive regulator of sigma E activity
VAGLRERGVVVSASGGSVDVRVAGGAACEACGQCCRIDRDGLTIEGAIDRFGARVGDEVEVEVPEEADVRAGIVVYVLPVAALLAGYVLGNLAGAAAGLPPDAMGAVGAVAGVSAGLLLLRLRGRAAASPQRLRPQVRAIIAPGLSAAPEDPERIDGDPPLGGSKGKGT